MLDTFTDTQLERICAVLAATSTGLTGSEIGKLLLDMGISDPEPTITKRLRLYEALKNRQQQDRCGNNVAAFIQQAMDPVRYTDRSEQFNRLRQELNRVLAFCGYLVGENGKLQKQVAVHTLTEAEERTDRLRAELQRRGVHGDVLKFCRTELLQNNYFHAVFEATKSVADKIRSRTGLPGDGAELVDQAFGSGKAGMPFLAFNMLQTETEHSEHSGLMNLMKGMFGAFRNVTAHAPRISWTISEQDALDLLTIASFLHRRLDSAHRTTRTM
ncbi:MAG: TIGR02391 family protein [Candidatus Brocadiia bacterium]